MATEQPSLVVRMRELAKTHPRSVDLIAAADEVERACTDYDGARRLLGVWSRARRIWIECSGESVL